MKKKFNTFLKKTKIKKGWSNLKNYLIKNKKNILTTLLLVSPFIIMDLFTRIFNKVDFLKFYYITPNLFTLIYIILFYQLFKCFKGWIGKTIYIILFVISFIFFLVNNIYFSITGNFFDFILLELAGEGSEYFGDALKSASLLVWIIALIIIINFILALKLNKGSKKNNWRKIGIVSLLFLIAHYLIPLTLGSANNELTFSTWRNSRNIYMNFNDANKSFVVSGLYEYTVRNFYITYLQTEKEANATDIAFIDSTINDEEVYQNKYTGKFKDKNLIFLQLEGIDDWVLTKEIMPNLYSLTKHAYNFTNHYSYYNGGGSTFNSEFAVNTGFITPLSFTQNAYTFNKNSFPFSMANIFKEAGYSINAFHMNSAEYYSRGINYKNWGYDNYYGLKDQSYYKKGLEYRLDRELILNPVFNELLFPTNQKFVDYIITYSNHMPFTSEKGVCKQILDLEKKENEENEETSTTETTKKEEKTTETTTSKVYTEQECVQIQAGETDYMIGLMLNKLEELNLLDNTIIVAFADHYLYTIEDKNILEEYKETDNNLINHTPFLIYNPSLKSKTIKEVNSQLDILPTILNLFGVEYHPSYYLGKDALDPNYKGIVFFSDYSWYDGKVYVENGEVSNNKYISKTNLEEKNNYINYLTEKNDKILKYDYFKIYENQGAKNEKTQ